jgi:hypothetical protein
VRTVFLLGFLLVLVLLEVGIGGELGDARYCPRLDFVNIPELQVVLVRRDHVDEQLHVRHKVGLHPRPTVSGTSQKHTLRG